jgi:hypothetical protein
MVASVGELQPPANAAMLKIAKLHLVGAEFHKRPYDRGLVYGTFTNSFSYKL